MKTQIDKAIARQWFIGGLCFASDNTAFDYVGIGDGTTHIARVPITPIQTKQEAKANASLIVKAVNEYTALNAVVDAAEQWRLHRFTRPISDHPEAIEQRRIYDGLINSLSTLATLRGEG